MSSDIRDWPRDKLMCLLSAFVGSLRELPNMEAVRRHVQNAGLVDIGTKEGDLHITFDDGAGNKHKYKVTFEPVLHKRTRKRKK